VAAADLSPADALLNTVKLTFPEKKGGGVFLEGDVGEVADRLIRILKEKTSVLA